MLEQNITYRPPEIPPVCGEGMLMVSLNIPLLRRLNVLNGLRRLFIVIERRQKPRLHANMQLLHFRGIHPKILPTQGPYPH